MSLIVSTPTQVTNPPPLEGLQAVRSGDNHTLLLSKEGGVYAAGDNRKAQLSIWVGNKTRFECYENLHTGISLFAATCESSAYVYGGTSIFIEGSEQWGELGRGDDVATTAASKGGRASLLGPLPGVIIDFTAGVWHYVVILEDGSIYGWGKARLGQLGNKLSGKVTAPTKIEDIPFKPAKAICGKDFTYIVGDPSTGEHILLGKDKFSIDSGKPRDVKGWKYIGATWHAIFVLFDDGKLVAWGKENMWDLLPPDLPPIEKIAVGSDHVLALTKDGELLSWGWGKHGNCGDLSEIKQDIRNDMISGFWNEISVPGDIEFIGAGFCTSFVVTKE
ncbi:alpha tubulin suppressor [Neocucurbitaria cava]|uniref:Alpha tubulin suppressor n=1 Tax=Neocucurbitaria cava TaxID=798079 RepID=A0A9W8YHJ4_9PLEO|nr:alpha tubulin suppressor [Neocucurbitaria cava]